MKHCGVHPALQARMTSVQQAFVNMLSENDGENFIRLDVTTEMAELNNLK